MAAIESKTFTTETVGEGKESFSDTLPGLGRYIITAGAVDAMQLR